MECSTMELWLIYGIGVGFGLLFAAIVVQMKEQS